MTDSHKTKTVERSDNFWPHLFDPFKGFGTMVSNFFAPSADASNSKDLYEINIELPGVDEKDIHVDVEDNVLTIQGEKKSESETKEKNYYFTERHYGSFQRSFRLPPDVKTDKIDAHFDKGILKVTIPKKAPAEDKAQKIKIRTSS
ncbi:Hsp20/alpha crystallin family protein [Sneathiella limimaris]|uniref:Hsp20/alpha crystallin family protein n=1 Tax=Sneathiella limimaris TaxID=1964213 RepID=UPI00146A39D3|nr:Hsp20/alpha crystallin family protein [Sneathiella limimaris]